MSSRAVLSLFLLSFVSQTLAEPASLPFVDCFDSNANVSQKINVSTVYAQALLDDNEHSYLNLTILANSPLAVEGYSNDSQSNLGALSV
jgi:hypothetical protein